MGAIYLKPNLNKEINEIIKNLYNNFLKINEGQYGLFIGIYGKQGDKNIYAEYLYQNKIYERKIELIVNINNFLTIKPLTKEKIEEIQKTGIEKPIDNFFKEVANNILVDLNELVYIKDNTDIKIDTLKNNLATFYIRI